MLDRGPRGGAASCGRTPSFRGPTWRSTEGPNGMAPWRCRPCGRTPRTVRGPTWSSTDGPAGR
eukprot:9485157-Pyramimonas_sp.AAC.1